MTERRITRREFIATGAAGVAILGLGGLPDPAAGKEASVAPEMVYRTLGKTGLKIPVVSFGVMNSDNPDLIRKALDLGIRHLDTAHSYLRGNSETVIGRVLEERQCRDKICLATKLWFDRDKEAKAFLGEESGKAHPATGKHFEEQLTLSLKRLRTDYVDILYLHSCDSPPMVSYEPMMKIFVRAKESGKARFIGVTTHTREPDVIRAAADTGVWDVVLTTYNFMQDHKDQVRKAIQYAAGKGMGIIAMKTQGGAGAIREKPGEMNHTAALKWALNDRNVCTAIPGITAFDQMDLDLGIMKDLALSEKEKQDLTDYAALAGPFYCQQCGACLRSCTRKVEIPTLMRAYMYSESYHNLIQAELAIGEIPKGRGLERCGQCETCQAVCRFGIDIPARLNSLMAVHFFEKRAV